MVASSMRLFSQNFQYSWEEYVKEKVAGCVLILFGWNVDVRGKCNMIMTYRMYKIYDVMEVWFKLYQK